MRDKSDIFLEMQSIIKKVDSFEKELDIINDSILAVGDVNT